MQAKLICLTRDKICLVDADDIKKLSEHKWFAMKFRNGSMYAATNFWRANEGRWRTVLMHRFLIDAKKGEIVDHINYDTLDNRKVNLRLCSRIENARHRRKHRTYADKETSSQYKGVTWMKKDNCWQAQLKYFGRNIYIGYFNKEQDAARARDKVAKELHGQFAELNFEDSN